MKLTQRLTDGKRLWRTYVKGGEKMDRPPDSISPAIWDSWKYSRDKGVDYKATDGVLADREKFERVLADNKDLLDSSVSYIESLYRNMIGTNYLFQLVSRDGYVLKPFTIDQKVLDIIYDKNVSLLDGAVVTEEAIGTNSSGLCLRIGEPVEILAAEHYQEVNHRFCCVSAPIFEDDRLRGCLTLMCPVEDYQTFTLGLVNATVDSIQKELQLRRAWKDTSKANKVLRTVFQLQNDGMMLMDQDYNILFHNEQAAEYLKLGDTSLLGRSLYEFVIADSLPQALRKPNGGFPETPINFKNINGEQCELTAQLIAVMGDSGDVDYILSYQPLKQSYTLVNKVSGSRAAYTFDSIIGDSDVIRRTIDQAKHAARSDSTVLIMGESGTGKELIAQSIHNASARSGGPFVAINCGSIPKQLIASELFGYEPGAFTGADKHGSPGKFELADGGTIFLDEIGDMPFDLQVSLLRVLEEHQVSRLGSKKPRNVNVRVIAATNRDLLERIRLRRFREDLYYRLNVLNITMPPLRERKDDIIVLAEYFMHRYNTALKKNVTDISDGARHLMMEHSWPGNVRELENTIERAVNFAMTNILTREDFPADIVRETIDIPQSSVRNDREDPGAKGQRAEYTRLQELLKKHRGNIKAISEETGVPASTLYGKLTRYGLHAKDYRTL